MEFSFQSFLVLKYQSHPGLPRHRHFSSIEVQIPSGTANFSIGCVNAPIYSSCGMGFEDDVGTRRTWSSFSSLNFLPVFKHRALCPRIAKTCGGMERPLTYSARLCFRSGP